MAGQAIDVILPFLWQIALQSVQLGRGKRNIVIFAQQCAGGRERLWRLLSLSL